MTWPCLPTARQLYTSITQSSSTQMALGTILDLNRNTAHPQSSVTPTVSQTGNLFLGILRKNKSPSPFYHLQKHSISYTQKWFHGRHTALFLRGDLHFQFSQSQISFTHRSSRGAAACISTTLETSIHLWKLSLSSHPDHAYTGRTLWQSSLSKHLRPTQSFLEPWVQPALSEGSQKAVPMAHFVLLENINVRIGNSLLSPSDNYKVLLYFGLFPTRALPEQAQWRSSQTVPSSALASIIFFLLELH